MNVGIFTDTEFGSANGVTTTLKAALRHAPAGMRLRIYTAATLPVVQDDFLALGSVSLPVPFNAETRLYIPPLHSYVKHARRDQLDLVHLTSPGPVGLAALFVSWRLRLPIVGSVHTDLAACAAMLSGSPRLGRLMRTYMQWPYGNCARVLVPSQHTRRLVLRGAGDARRIALWPRGVDTELFTPAKRSPGLREQWHVSARRPALLYVGRLARDKGVGLLPQLRDRLHARGIEHRMILVGDGPMLPQLRAALPDAQFAGVLSREAVADAFASADLLLFPSRTDAEGNVVLEAQASGLPVVVAGDGGARENMLSGRTGRICYTDESDEWGSAIAVLLGDDLAATRGAARQYALTRRWERALAPLYRAYRELGAGATPAPVVARAVTTS